MRHSALVFEGLLDQLKWCPERKDPLDCSGRRNLHVVISSLRDVAIAGQTAESVRHLGESIVRLQKAPSRWIDKRDPGRHVGENFLVKNYFALQTPGRFRLPAVQLAAKDGKDSLTRPQPDGQQRHPAD